MAQFFCLRQDRAGVRGDLSGAERSSGSAEGEMKPVEVSDEGLWGTKPSWQASRSISPWPSWDRSPKLQSTHTLPGLQNQFNTYTEILFLLHVRKHQALETHYFILFNKIWLNRMSDYLEQRRGRHYING